MNKKIDEIKNRAEGEIKNCADLKSLEDIKIKYLGRKGELNQILRSLGDLSLEEKKVIGPKAQSLRNELDVLIENKKNEFLSKKSRNSLDVTRPGKKIKIGHLHPLTIIENEIIDIFRSMSFSIIDGGPEVETEYYNFDALNIPKNHPAREMHDTFWLQDNQKQLTHDTKQLTESQRSKVKGQKLLLRTHTSPMQIRYMETHKPPFQIVVPGRVFRYEATDASHEINFNQIECLMVGKDVNLTNFKYIIQEFFTRLFKKKLEVRLRPSYFPFVEPGLEIDIQCVKCGGKGCNICKESGWLEIMGAGMVHPNVLKAGGYDPREYQGFAFGLGCERVAMLKYNIPDIRMFYSGDLKFINQF
ncbi:MAG: phenylalanine--tRNA ligase subunit alpha [bacterium]|nr:phenylalanine--tRNA ligase subunit alpha [bacterium]